MDETSLEDLMLKSAFSNFSCSLEQIESQVQKDSNIYEVQNQIEVLKEILVQAEFQLRCYRCHQNLLKKDQKTLLASQTNLKQEVLLIQTEKNPKKLEFDAEIEKLNKEKKFLEEQCVNFEYKINGIQISSNSLVEFNKDLSFKSRNKEMELRKLVDEADSIRDKSTNANNSSLKGELEKSGTNQVSSQKFSIGSYFSGVFKRKSDNDSVNNGKLKGVMK